jgi:site-specific recombinase XerD
VFRFFEEYLPHLRGMSAHTIRSYRDALVLFLRFAAADAGRPIERLAITDLDRDRVMRFLEHLEKARGNAVATRNARLAALHTFARFLIAERPEHLAMLQGVLAVPFKRGAREAPIEYLEADEIAALLQSIDRTAPGGERDYVLFALFFNTGARVQEILDLRVRDVRFDPPHQVRLHGKGNKVRLCPIWPSTARLLRRLVERRPPGTDEDPAAAIVFRNQRGKPLTRFGVRYRLAEASGLRFRRGSDTEREATASPLAPPQHGGPTAQGRRRLRHHQPVAGTLERQHHDALCTRRHRLEEDCAGGRSSPRPRPSKPSPPGSTTTRNCSTRSPPISACGMSCSTRRAASSPRI